MNHKHADLDEAWRDYQEMVIPDNAGLTQIEETRRAFYAGAATVAGFMMNWSSMDLAPKDGAAAIDSLTAQIETFIETIPECDDLKCENCFPVEH